VVVDADSGAVIDGREPHLRLPPASTIKILTALIATTALGPSTPVPVSPNAAAMPAMKLDLRRGQVWRSDDLLRGLLMHSANDAAVALAERVGGSRQGFADEMHRVAGLLGVVDDPILDDPAGLDDASAFGRSDLISAYDLAIVARAALAVPTIREIVARRAPYSFVAPQGGPLVVRPQNKLLSDPTVIGIKPGYTARAGETLIAAATRSGRTVISVELGAHPQTMWTTAQSLLARGFETPGFLQAPLPHLPAVVALPASAAAISDTAPAPPPTTAAGAPGAADDSGDTDIPVAAIGAAVVALVLVWHLGARRRGKRRLGRPPA
jgi:D-alanyl-D-alanine carboxypeptidase (penicillin-binding protein 5/6)